LVLALVVATGAPGVGSAAAKEQLVYWPLVSDGTEYRRVSYPNEAGPLRVLAGTEVVLDLRRAPVSYWPITREHLADLSAGSEVTEGTLEIVGASGDATSYRPEVYVIWHPSGVGAGAAQLVRGERAEALYEDYVRRARKAAEQAKQYQQIVAEHQALVEAWLRMAGERRGANVPDPPPELTLAPPPPYYAFATEPRPGFIVSLPPGRYTVRLRGAGGDIVSGSERRLLSFGPIDQGFGYVVRPENRWTQPVVSFAPDEVIYTTGETGLFLEPVPVAEYQALHFTRLFRPQSAEVTDPSLTVWVPRNEKDGAVDAALAVWNGAERIRTVPRSGYRVLQIPDASRGYRIEEFHPTADEALEADFHAMRLDPASAATTVRLLQDGSGQTLEGSHRRVRSVRPPPQPLLLLPALLPLALGLAVRTAARRRR
jgi:hypothetical protein